MIHFHRGSSRSFSGFPGVTLTTTAAATPEAATITSSAIPTSAALASEKKLRFFFHMTAQAIVHKRQLHDKLFASSSRSTMDAWYHEIKAQGVPILDWDAWIVDRVQRTAAALDGGALDGVNEEEDAEQDDGNQAQGHAMRASGPFTVALALHRLLHKAKNGGGARKKP